MPAPTYRVQIDKGMGLTHWSNDYLLVETSMDNAAAHALNLINMERSIHGDIVTFNWARISTYNTGDRVFRHIPINLPGQQEAHDADWLPIFNTLRADFGTTDADPCRKYFRCPVLEVWQTNGVITPSVLTTLTNLIAVVLPGGSTPVAIVSSKGNLVTSLSVHPQVQMRQTYRRSKRKVTA